MNSNTQRLVLFVLLPLLGAAGGPASAQAIPVVASTSAEIAASSAAPKYTWALEDVIRIALEDNPDIQSARDNLEAASRVVEEAYGGYLPQVDVAAESARTTLPSPSAGSTALLGLNRPYTDARVGIHQTLFDFGRGLDDIRARRAESRSAEEDLAALRNVIQLGAERAFYDVAAAQKLVEVAQESLLQFQETHRRADVLVQTGVRPAFDLTQAQVELSKARLALINAKNARDLAKIALLNIMGMPRVETFALSEPASGGAPPRADSLNMQRLTDLALISRPEMRRYQFQKEAALDRLRREREDYLPSLGASGWYGRYLPDYPDALRSAWGYGVGVSWNLFDGLGTAFRVKELEARLDQEEALAKRQSQNIVAEVATSYMNLMRAEQNETVAEEGLVYAKENFNYAKLRYDSDVGTILELLVAETSLVDADAVQVQARYRSATALAALRRAVNAPLGEGAK